MWSVVEDAHLILLLFINPASIVLIGKFGGRFDVKIGTLATQPPNNTSIFSGDFVDAISDPC
jgi:hypothetical protein